MPGWWDDDDWEYAAAMRHVRRVLSPTLNYDPEHHSWSCDCLYYKETGSCAHLYRCRPTAQVQALEKYL